MGAEAMGAFNVVVTGNLLPGFSREQVVPQLAQLFNQSTDAASHLLQGHPVTIKRQTDAATAERYVQRLRQIGVECEAEADVLEADSGVFSTPSFARSSNPEPPPVPTSESPPPLPEHDTMQPPRLPTFALSSPGGAATDDALWQAIAQKNADYYVPKWKRYAAGESAFPSWHWPAFFLGFWWALYRKAWAGAAIILVASIGLACIFAVLGSLAEENSHSSDGLAGFLYSIAYFAGWFVPSLLANGLYFRKAKALIAQARVFSPDPNAQVAYLSAKGGTSGGVFVVLIVLACISGIGILAAIALPAYQDYITRAKVSEALVAVEPIKVQIAEEYQSTGHLPDIDFGSIKNGPAGKYLQDIDMSERGVLTLTFELPGMKGKTVLVVPSREGETIAWTCHNVDVPNKYLPVACRNKD
jgi:type II secretory pathway pseudopilin PulG